MCCFCDGDGHGMPRRDFIKTVGATVGGISLASGGMLTSSALATSISKKKQPATVMGAFVYPPSEKLRKVGYYSWPGSSFDAEGRQKQYMAQIKEIARKLNMRIDIEKKPVDEEADLAAFVTKVKQKKPDGLLLIPFKKSHFEQTVKIIDETQVPTVVLATLGVLLIGHVRRLRDRAGVYMISSQDNLIAVESGMKMIRTGRRMKDGLIVNIDGAEVVETTVPFIGTTVRKIPHQRFYDLFAQAKATDQVQALANEFLTTAQKIVQPSKKDIVEAAKTYFVFKDIIAAEQADAVMMNCLPGLQRPHKHVPPCMGYMKLRDEGTPMGCESDLDATLTMMIEQELCDRPAFQHNPSTDSEKNTYFCAHCTSASKMNGVTGPSEPYMLMSHAEAGWGTVPRVLFKEGQEITIAKYLSSKNGEKPQMLLYSGDIVGCPPIPPTGGCRTNMEATINELDLVSDLKGHHLCMIYGNYVRQLKHFCQLYDIEVAV